MSRIRGSGTKPELRVLDVCRTLRRRYLRNASQLPGKPDFVFPRGKVAIFVHGCFWHSHDCPKGMKFPVQNADFWADKRAKTVARDSRKQAELEQLGYKVQVIWECQTKSPEQITSILNTSLQLTK